MKTIFVYDRPFTSRFTSQYRKLFGGTYDIVYLSDFKYRDDVGLIARQYHHLAHSDVEADRGLDYAVVSRRCRYLRSLDQSLSRRLINAAWLAIEEVFQRHDPDAFIGLPMDNYYLDLIDQYCIANGIFTINPVQSFLPDRTRICRRGEYIHVRDVTSGEIAEYRTMLQQKRFRPTWLSKSRSPSRLMRMYLREIAKRLFFRTAKLVKRDPFSFHYNGVYPIGATINPSSADLLKIRSLFERDLGVLEHAASSHRAAVFLPLQFVPESSIDYNIQDSRFSSYEELLDRILAALPADVLLLVKEHPDMYGYRRLPFFHRFRGISNVMLVDVDITVQQLFDFCEFVLVTGGASTGAEAVVKGKTVISLGGAFYGGTGAIHEVESFDDVARWPDFLVPTRNDDRAIDDVLRRILTNTLPGAYDFVRIRPQAVEAAVRNVTSVMDYVADRLSRPAPRMAASNS